MPMAARTNLFEIRVEQSDSWKHDNQDRALTIFLVKFGEEC